MNEKAIDRVISEMLNLLLDHQDLLKEALQILEQDMKHMEEMMKAQESITQKNSELEQQISLQRVLELKVGDTLMLNATPDSLVELRAGAVPLTRGRMGRRNHHIAVRVEAPLSPSAKAALQRFR